MIKGTKAKYSIVRTTKTFMLIKDVGHTTGMTVTNDAEAVVEELVENKWLAPGLRLFYIDSEGSTDEILMKDGKFKTICTAPAGVSYEDRL